MQRYLGAIDQLPSNRGDECKSRFDTTFTGNTVNQSDGKKLHRYSVTDGSAV
jgi:hypothetical protein